MVQETIALYEERLSAADRERYELEARIASLEAGARATERTPSPTAPPKVASSATEIDNETLRDQVVHLTKKVAKLEDAIEDAHATSERDEAALADRMRRLKEKEEAMKKELGEGRKEVERMIKSEASARRRVEEVEEALQESTVALEDARAEVEGLRAELTVRKYPFRRIIWLTTRRTWMAWLQVTASRVTCRREWPKSPTALLLIERGLPRKSRNCRTFWKRRGEARQKRRTKWTGCANR